MVFPQAHPLAIAYFDGSHEEYVKRIENPQNQLSPDMLGTQQLSHFANGGHPRNTMTPWGNPPMYRGFQPPAGYPVGAPAGVVSRNSTMAQMFEKPLQNTPYFAHSPLFGNTQSNVQAMREGLETAAVRRATGVNEGLCEAAHNANELNKE